MSQKDHNALDLLVAAGLDMREKRELVRQARAAFTAARKRFDALFADIASGQSVLPLKQKPEPKSEAG